MTRLAASTGTRRTVCLVLGDPDGSTAAALTRGGLEPQAVTGEAETLLALQRQRVAAVLAGGRITPPVLQAVVAQAAQQRPAVPVIVLGASNRLQDAVDAMQLGVADYVPPGTPGDELVARLRKAMTRVQPEPESAAPPVAGLVGGSAAMRQVYTTIEKISRYRCNVLLRGESGTGKELIARALHARGPRRGHLFVPINCATLGREILENELFGHERGAFTGANERKKGLFELADGGTLFLDEIGELDPSTQAKLLRVLERNEFRRVGGTEKISVDLSVVAATNRDLEQAIAARRFREDLYYRLKVVTIVVPPLRQRREDIPALIESFIADFNRRHGGELEGIAPDALRALREHDWPGNVRELKNAIESAAVLASDSVIRLEALGEPFASSPPAPVADLAGPDLSGALRVPPEASLADIERLLILDRLKRCGTRNAAAASLGIGLRTLYTKLRQYGLAR